MKFPVRPLVSVTQDQTPFLRLCVLTVAFLRPVNVTLLPDRVAVNDELLELDELDELDEPDPPRVAVTSADWPPATTL